MSAVPLQTMESGQTSSRPATERSEGNLIERSEGNLIERSEANLIERSEANLVDSTRSVIDSLFEIGLDLALTRVLISGQAGERIDRAVDNLDALIEDLRQRATDGGSPLLTGLVAAPVATDPP